KSGWPVLGQTQVNSGHSKRISYSRPGRGLGKVSSDLLGRVGIRAVSPPAARGVNRAAGLLERALRDRAACAANHMSVVRRSYERHTVRRAGGPPSSGREAAPCPGRGAGLASRAPRRSDFVALFRRRSPTPAAPPSPEPPGLLAERNRETGRM